MPTPWTHLMPQLLISTTTPSSSGSPEQPNALQGAYHPHYQDYQGGLHSSAPPHSGPSSLDLAAVYLLIVLIFLQWLNSRYTRIHQCDVCQPITQFRLTPKWSSPHQTPAALHQSMVGQLASMCILLDQLMPCPVTILLRCPPHLIP